MFEDLVPPGPPQTPPPPLGFDDLIPNRAADVAPAAKLAAPERADEQALPRSTAGTDPGDERIEPPARNGQLTVPASGETNAGHGEAAPPGIFDDLIPAAARAGGAAAAAQGGVAPAYEPVFDRWLGLKDRTIGIPLVREFTPGRFIADIAGEDDGGVYWKDPNTGEIRRQGFGELIVPEGGKYKVYERLENIRPWTWTDMALIQAIKSGFTAPHDALAGNMAPSEAGQRALDTASLAVAGTTFTPLRNRPLTAAERRPLPLSADVPDFGSGVLRIAGKALENARQSLSDMFEGVSREAPKVNKTVDLGIITPEGAARLNGLLREAGIETDVAGFRHTVDSYAARHSFRRHGDFETERARGQLPVTHDDWAMIPNILSSPDLIEVLPRRANVRDAIGYWKNVDGYVLYLEEIRTGGNTLAATSMRKYKRGATEGQGVPGRPNEPVLPRSTAITDPSNPNIDDRDADR